MNAIHVAFKNVMKFIAADFKRVPSITVMLLSVPSLCILWTIRLVVLLWHFTQPIDVYARCFNAFDSWMFGWRKRLPTRKLAFFLNPWSSILIDYQCFSTSNRLCFLFTTKPSNLAKPLFTCFGMHPRPVLFCAPGVLAPNKRGETHAIRKCPSTYTSRVLLAIKEWN